MLALRAGKAAAVEQRIRRGSGYDRYWLRLFAFVLEYLYRNHLIAICTNLTSNLRSPCPRKYLGPIYSLFYQQRVGL